MKYGKIKIAGNWGDFPLQTRYLVKRNISTCCAHHIRYTFHIGSGLVV